MNGRTYHGKLGEKPTLLMGSYRWQLKDFFLEKFQQTDPQMIQLDEQIFFQMDLVNKPPTSFLGVGWK